LLASTFGTPQKVEQAVAEERRFEANLAHGEAALAAAQRQMAVLDTEESQLRAAAKVKRAASDLAKIELGYTRIAAPIDGLVSERGVRAGQYVHDGTQVISVVPLRNVWVIANYKETQLTHVKIGQRAEITIDTFPGVVVMGRIDSISPPAARSSRCYRPTTPPAISPRSCSASRSRSRSIRGIRSRESYAPGCR
jgi:membrane fusion protein (multidrug efflux system)